MLDSVGQELEPGAIVVVKPTSRTSFMGMGYVKKVNRGTVSVRSFRRTSWYDKEAHRVTGNFQQTSVFMVRSAHDMKADHCFPEVFPEELKEEYINEFLTRNTTSS